jgi:hypothetical protein
VSHRVRAHHQAQALSKTPVRTPRVNQPVSQIPTFQQQQQAAPAPLNLRRAGGGLLAPGSPDTGSVRSSADFSTPREDEEEIDTSADNVKVGLPLLLPPFRRFSAPEQGKWVLAHKGPHLQSAHCGAERSQAGCRAAGPPVQVVIRMRPPNATELATGTAAAPTTRSPFGECRSNTTAAQAIPSNRGAGRGDASELTSACCVRRGDGEGGEPALPHAAVHRQQ